MPVEGGSFWLDDEETGLEYLVGTRDFASPKQRLCGANPGTCDVDIYETSPLDEAAVVPEDSDLSPFSIYLKNSCSFTSAFPYPHGVVLH